MFKRLYEVIKERLFRLLIVDESHFIRTVHYGKESKFTKTIKNLSRKIKNVIFLSGTPSVNRPINIFHQIKFLINNRNIFSKNKYAFGEEFCKKICHRGEKIYEQNLRSWEFYIFLKKTVLIRRTIQDVYKEQFPNLRRFFIYLSNDRMDMMSIYSRHSMEHKNGASATRENTLSEKKQIINNSFNVSVKSKKKEEGLLKIANGLQWLNNHFPQKKKILFCYHLEICSCIEEEVLKLIKKNEVEEREKKKGKEKEKEKEKCNTQDKYLNDASKKEDSRVHYIVVNGSLNEKEKIEKINFFRREKNCLFGIFTIGSVNHGFDFTFCNLCFFFELPVNFFQLQQCESRLFRKNQIVDTFIFYFVLKNGLGSDTKTWKRFLNCANSTRSIIDGNTFSHKDLISQSYDNRYMSVINKENERNICFDKEHNYNFHIKKGLPDVKFQLEETCSNDWTNHLEEVQPLMHSLKEMKPSDVEEQWEEKRQCSKGESGRIIRNKTHSLYNFKMNPLTNTLHIYGKNVKINLPVELVDTLRDEEMKKYAKTFLQKYNRLNGNEKKRIQNKKCDPNISLLTYTKRNNHKQKLQFERYIKNVILQNKTYVKAYIPMGFKGLYKNYYYQEYDEKSNIFKCLNCAKSLKFSSSRISEHTELMNCLKQIEPIDNIIEQFKRELKQIQMENKNIKKIILCNEHDLFCHGDCRKHYFLKKNSNSIRRLIFERDQGICNICNLDCPDLLKQIQRMKYFSVEEKINYFIKQNPLFIENVQQLKRIISSPKKGYIWQVDHILPVCKGGGQATFENLQTLCTFCHQQKTKNDLQNKKETKNKKRDDSEKKGKKSKYFQEK